MQAWAKTDPGILRSQNQDFYAIEELEDGSLLAVVCDGMGGAKAGNVASRLACEVFVNEIRRSFDARLTEDELASMMDGAAALANMAVHDNAELSAEFSGMGTTLVAALVRGTVAYCVNVGDSRAYYLCRDRIRQITVDHSVVEMMVRQGEITREEARAHPVKNLITRAIGTSDTVMSDLFRQPMNSGDFLLLCSDGLSNMMDDQELLFEVAHGGTPEQCCERLIAITLERGAPDNVTALLIAV